MSESDWNVPDGEVAKRILEVVPRLMRLLVAEARQEAPSEQLTLPQFKVLSRLVEREYLPSELARSFEVSLPTMTVVVDNLAKRGLVLRRADPQDRRMVRLSPTTEGRDVFERFRQRVIARLARGVGLLHQEEKRQLFGALDALCRAVTLAVPQGGCPELHEEEKLG